MVIIILIFKINMLICKMVNLFALLIIKFGIGDLIMLGILNTKDPIIILIDEYLYRAFHNSWNKNKRL